MSNLKFRAWDSMALTETAKLISQLKQKIEELCEKNEVNPADLPDSLISTDKMYFICVAYLGAYDKLVEYDLLKTGNIKQTNNIH